MLHQSDHYTAYTQLWQFAEEVAGHLTRLEAESWRVQPFPKEERDKLRSVSVYRIDAGEELPQGRPVSCPSFRIRVVDWANIDALGTRIVISGSYPSYKGQSCTPYHEALPKITVAVKRGTAVVAREIQRRFLKTYLRIYELATKTAESSQAYDESRNSVIEKVADALGVPTRESFAGRGDLMCDVPGDPLDRRGTHVSGRFTSYGPGAVVLNLGRCPTDLAVSIARMIREYLDAAQAKAEGE